MFAIPLNSSLVSLKTLEWTVKHRHTIVYDGRKKEKHRKTSMFLLIWMKKLS